MIWTTWHRTRYLRPPPNWRAPCYDIWTVRYCRNTQRGQESACTEDGNNRSTPIIPVPLRTSHCAGPAKRQRIQHSYNSQKADLSTLLENDAQRPSPLAGNQNRSTSNVDWINAKMWQNTSYEWPAPDRADSYSGPYPLRAASSKITPQYKLWRENQQGLSQSRRAKLGHYQLNEPTACRCTDCSSLINFEPRIIHEAMLPINGYWRIWLTIEITVLPQNKFVDQKTRQRRQFSENRR